ncbi:MAG TPA: ribose 5-phosphate isomerase B [Paludibacteraceae bacterium]|jgi:ribose 5-phosphate isomerase B|nr:ribose 5-phosphate isomerase B [Paludibacteraceae bacterium]HPT42801.1 ribose 5-phosphate isomerase B [Paludibacteraceae bacterium]
MKPFNELRIAICNDHAGYQLKTFILKYITEKAPALLKDFGCDSPESCDYPDYAHPMATAIENGLFDYGISICGTGNGISMVLNKHQGIRAALCWNEEIAVLGRLHNNANIISLPARFISEEQALKMIDAFFSTDFEGGRHQRRIDKIPVK